MPLQATVSVVYRDEKKRKGQTQLNIPPATAAVLQAPFLASLDDAILSMHDLTDCEIIGAHLSIPLTLPVGLRAAPLAGSDVEEKLTMSFATADPFYSSMSIPGYNESANLPGSAKVDIANEDVDQLIATVVGGGFTNNQGADLVEFVDGYQSFNNRGKSKE